MGNVKIKRILASAAAAWAACVLAADWMGTAGNFQLDDASNWAHCGIGGKKANAPPTP